MRLKKEEIIITLTSEALLDFPISITTYLQAYSKLHKFTSKLFTIKHFKKYNHVILTYYYLKRLLINIKNYALSIFLIKNLYFIVSTTHYLLQHVPRHKSNPISNNVLVS